jgi:hypothetical protein
MKRLLFALAGLAALALAPTAQAAFQYHINYGAIGHVSAYDPRVVEGGKCSAPEQFVKCSNYPNDGNYDQIFVGRYRAATAPYGVRQSVSSKVYLYWLDTANNVWRQYLIKNEGTCANLAANGNGACGFGSTAPDVGSGCTSVAGYPRPCIPAFINLDRGFHWTVAVRVTWFNYNTGGTLAQADYYPTNSGADIGCAPYAVSIGRCSGPHAWYKLNLHAPGNVGMIYMG